MNRKLFAVAALTLGGIIAAVLIPVDELPAQDRRLGTITFRTTCQRPAPSV